MTTYQVFIPVLLKKLGYKRGGGLRARQVTLSQIGLKKGGDLIGGGLNMISTVLNIKQFKIKIDFKFLQKN